MSTDATRKTMTPRKVDPVRELTPDQFSSLGALDSRAAEFSGGIQNVAERRYIRYRKMGMAPGAALGAVKAWATNMEQQRERRVSHQTGAA